MLDHNWQVSASGKEPLPDLEGGLPYNGVPSGMPPDPQSIPVWPANWPVPGTTPNPLQPIKVARDMHMITTKGFRTLGLASTFIAGVEAQFFSIVATMNIQDNVMLQASSGLLLVGILLSAFGAIGAFISSRWFELLTAEEVEWLEHRWAYARRETNRPIPPGQNSRHPHRLRNWLVAKSLMMPFYLILFGCLSFVVGVILYTWATQIRPIALACTVVTGLCGFVILGMYLKFEAKGVLSSTNFTRVRL
ncbi:unnamed protein product [Rhizoctonia solani]|uniref:Transmembrane protein n=1 Tax=Rhizoctonia solani TaxID=456999 RepID=A0A8H3DYS1_9AGAM|nr:unnamed protein product [Rhizoctonia solani]